MSRSADQTGPPGAGAAATPVRVAGLILAAGYSSRMGRLKPLIELGGMTLLARAAGLLRGVGAEPVVAVLGHRAQEVRPEALALGLNPVVNPDYDRGMLSSVQAGFAALPEQAEAVFVLPVDIPLVRPATPERVLAAWRRERPAAAIPAFVGRTGHPPLVDLGLRQGILSWDGPRGLGGFLEACGGRVLQVPVADRFTLADADTPEQLAALERVWPAWRLPDRDECLVMLELAGADRSLLAHSLAVAAAAMRLGRALAAAGLPQDQALIEAGGLLHDLGKGRPGHDAAGAAMCLEWGFPEAAAVVRAHLDLPGEGLGPLDAAAVVHLADKLIRGRELVSLDERFSRRLGGAADDPGVRAASRRLRAARRLADRLAEALGRPAAEILAVENDDYDLPAASR